MDEFIDRARPRRRRELTDFEETELTGETEIFGDVAHRLSGYAKRGTLNGAAFAARGVISRSSAPDGWRISAMPGTTSAQGSPSRTPR